jgi:hypothetical protein
VVLAAGGAACASTGEPTVGAGGTDTALNFSRGRSATVGGGGLAVAPTTLGVPVDQAWEALLKALPAIGVPVDAASPQSWTAGTPATQVRRRFAGERISAFLACGGSAGVAEVADSHVVTIGVLATLTATAEGTSLQVQVAGAAKDPFTSVPARHCSTRGRLEAKVDSVVRAFLVPV